MPALSQRYVTLSNGGRDVPCQRIGRQRIAAAVCACLAMAQTKPDSSRAIATVITVGSLPARTRDEPPASGRNGERNFRGERRSNETHASATDPEARLARKSGGQESKMGFTGHLPMENRNGLIVDARLTLASGTAEPEAALDMLGELPAAGHKTVGADKNHDAAAFVAAARALEVTPHVAQNITAHRGSHIDGRTTRHSGYRVSQVIRKRIEEANGWIKEGWRRPSSVVSSGSAGCLP